MILKSEVTNRKYTIHTTPTRYYKNNRVVGMKLFCVVSILVTFTTAYPSYRLKIPNAWRVPCPDGEEGCSEGESNMNQPESVCNGIGHASCAGGMQDKTLSNFGEDFAAAGFEWTLELCQKDSDGDGQTNGEELGDPCCT